jgi:hypothetical protein
LRPSAADIACLDPDMILLVGEVLQFVSPEHIDARLIGDGRAQRELEVRLVKEGDGGMSVARDLR